MDNRHIVVKTEHKNIDNGFASPEMIAYLTPPKDIALQEDKFNIELDFPLLENPEQTQRIDVQIYYKVLTRPGSEKWMLLVNGFASSVKLWDYQLAYFLRSGYNLVMFDLLGQGSSSKPNGVKYSIEAQVAIIQRLVEVSPLAERKFILTGISAGGIISQAYALKYQHQLKALCLLATTPKVDGRLAFTQEIQRLFLNNPTMGERDKISACAYFLMDHIFSDTFFRKFKPIIYGIIDNNINNNTVGTYLGALSSVDDFDVVDQIHQITVPTLIFSGLHDKTIETHYGIILNRLIPNSQRFVLKGVYASHTFIVELFETFNEVFIDELNKLDQFRPSKNTVFIENSFFQEHITEDGPLIDI